MRTLALALLLLAATPVAASHLEPAPVTTCWTDGVWGTYVTHVTPESNPTFLRVTGYLLYPDGSFKAPLSGGGFRYPNGMAGVTLHYFAHGLSFSTLVNLYHHLGGGTAHLYYYHEGQDWYDPLPVWPVECP